ncbi:hypothetical protein BDV25DRAFT_142369 [Aspergillus avenaceus]|uniref:CorA-like transporter domain-containing protein n=1 Tax=Aspergillus avenaceus TaxID=36643 RepID=A0A5N6TP04_ASPAV|nr:hypothetical protein BDV25DRAFT_142369 [Aspergillus avenaceus]
MDHLPSAPKVDDRLEEQIQARKCSLFRARNDRPQLKISLLFKLKFSNAQVLECKSRTITQGLELEHFRQEENKACTQIFTISQLRSWTTLDISSEVLQRLLLLYDVFPQFWKILFTFGIKIAENEYTFPTIRGRCSQAVEGKIYELAYVIRRVEHNRRANSAGECPWSIRQTGVYHKLTYPHSGSSSTSMFILVAPSGVIEDDVHRCFPKSSTKGDTVLPHFSLHESLVVDSLRGWMEYMGWLEDECKQKTDRLVVWDASDNAGDRMAYFDVEDRQRLEQLEDYISDLMVILQTAVETIDRIGKSCRHHCQISCSIGTGCSCSYIIQEFEESTAEARVYAERAKALQSRVQSTTQLLTYLLSFEETRALKQLAQASHVETKALKQLAEASNLENQSVVELTKRSAEDATAVKMLSLVGLIYLPSTIVANFFSTEFIQVNEKGEMHISLIWWMFVRYGDRVWPPRQTRDDSNGGQEEKQMEAGDLRFRNGKDQAVKGLTPHRSLINHKAD